MMMMMMMEVVWYGILEFNVPPGSGDNWNSQLVQTHPNLSHIYRKCKSTVLP